MANIRLLRYNESQLDSRRTKMTEFIVRGVKRELTENDINKIADILSTDATFLVVIKNLYSQKVDIVDLITAIVNQLSKEKDKDIETESRLFMAKSFRRGKKRWVTSAVTDYTKFINGEKYSKKSELIKAFKLVEEDYGTRFGLSSMNSTAEKPLSPQEILSNSIETLKNWASSDDSKYSRYPFLPDKTPRQIDNAVELDVKKAIFDFLTAETSTPAVAQIQGFDLIDDIFMQVPLNLPTGIVSSTDMIKLSKEDMTSINGLNIYRKIIRTELMSIAVTFTAEEDIIESIVYPGIKESLYNLEEDVFKARQPISDFEIIDAIIRTNISNQGLKISFTNRISDLAQALYGSKSSGLYPIILRRLLQLRGLSISQKISNIDENNKKKPGTKTMSYTKDYTFISMLQFTMDGNRLIVQSSLSEYVLQNYVKNKSFAINREEFSKYSKIEKNFIVFLQATRYNFYNLSSPNITEDYLQNKQHEETILNYVDFISHVIFEQKNKSTRKKHIEAILDKLVANQFVILNYRNFKDEYFISFSPISEEERKIYARHPNVQNPIIN